MSLFDNPDQLKLLQNLLNPTQKGNDSDSDYDDDGEASLVLNKLTPAGIGPQSHQKPKSSTAKAKTKKPNPLATPLAKSDNSQPEPKTLEEWEAMQERENSEMLETRQCPEYKMTYRQAVGTEDVFLQMNNRTAASASCEDLIVDIELPEETVAVEKMNLSIMERAVDLATPVYRLKLPLPHAVDIDLCRAKYDSDNRRLILTLRLRRELDFVNF